MVCMLLCVLTRCLATCLQVNIHDLVDGLVETYGSMARFGVKLFSSVAASVPPTWPLDPLRIRQVIANGLTNALKQTSAGAVQLHVRAPLGSQLRAAMLWLWYYASTQLVTHAYPVIAWVQVEMTSMPSGEAGLLIQVIDSGPGLGGKDFQTLFDPTGQAGELCMRCLASLCWWVCRFAVSDAILLMRQQTGRPSNRKTAFPRLAW